MKGVYALYPDGSSAQRAVDGLRKAGVADTDITVITSSPMEDFEFSHINGSNWLWYIACAGGVIGFAAVTALTYYASYAWPMQQQAFLRRLCGTHRTPPERCQHRNWPPSTRTRQAVPPSTAACWILTSRQIDILPAASAPRRNGRSPAATVAIAQPRQSLRPRPRVWPCVCPPR